jgi:hypothetical protein
MIHPCKHVQICRSHNDLPRITVGLVHSKPNAILPLSAAVHGLYTLVARTYGTGTKRLGLTVPV